MAKAGPELTRSGVIVTPVASVPVKGARVEVDRRLVATTGSNGHFYFTDAWHGSNPVTITVVAMGLARYELEGVTAAQSGDTLDVALSHKPTVEDVSPGPARQGLDSGATAGGGSSAGSGRNRLSSPANCGGYTSNVTPPSSILVLEFSQHTASGAPVAGTETGIFQVPFETYVDDVLPNEWISGWDTQALDAGAMAVKTYGWYWIDNWRGGTYKGQCYNVDDSTDYQRYIPGLSASTTNAAIAATWNTIATRSGAIFEASYQATLTGSTSEACGAGLSNYPDTLSQWGSQNCAALGDEWQEILSIYYPGVAFAAADVSFQMFTISATGNLYERPWNGGWGAWSDLSNPGVTLSGTPGDVYDPTSSTLLVFAVGSNGVIYERAWNGSWGAWQVFGSNFRGGVTAIYQNGQLDLFAVSATGNLYERAWSDGWGAWWDVSNPGVTLSGTPGVAYDPTDRTLQAFAVGSNGVIYERAWSGSWGAWQVFDSTFRGGVTLIYQNGQLDLFAVSATGNLYERAWSDGWGAWWDVSNPGVTLGGTPGVAYDPVTGTFQVLAVGSNGVIYERAWSGTWGAWQEFGRVFSGGASVVEDNAG